MITTQEMAKLEELAKLSFSDEEKLDLINKLKSTLNMIDTLQTIDCRDVVPLRSVCDISQRMVADQVEINDISEELFQQIPVKNADLAREVKYFIVPKMVE